MPWYSRCARSVLRYTMLVKVAGIDAVLRRRAWCRSASVDEVLDEVAGLAEDVGDLARSPCRGRRPTPYDDA